MEKSCPDISVITITYNLISAGRGEQVRQCFESLYQQQDCQYEHIVIDGGSTDGTLDLLQNYAQEGKLRYYSEPDKGIYDAMNKGVRQAKGRYVTFLNSDDYYNNNNGLADSIKALVSSGARVSYSPAQLLENGNFRPRTTNINQLLNAMSLCHQGMLFDRKLFEELGEHDISFRIAGDYDFVLRCFLNNIAFVYVDTSFAVFRMGGVSTQYLKLSVEEDILAKSRNFKLSIAECREIRETGFIPYAILCSLLARTQIKNDFPIYLSNFLAQLKLLRKKAFSLRTRKGRREFILLGLTLYKE